ncbi:MAG: N-acetyltransferase family protein [Mycobacteriales bacterium]|nr:GNAT family N-acetyltransferase [Frankia sp.]
MLIEPFANAHVDACAELFAERHRRACRRHQLLAAVADPIGAIEERLRAGARGYVAIDGTTVTGYLLAELSGPEAWAQYASHAARDERSYRHLYAAASADWVARGGLRHAVVTDDGDTIGEPAFANLAFGREHVFALGPVAPVPTPPPGIDVRRATPTDIDSVVGMADLLSRHLAGPPVWSPAPPGKYDEDRAAVRQELSAGGVTYFVASIDGSAVGFATWEPMPPRIGVPNGAVAMSHVAVRPEARGRGVGRALDAAARAWARESGYTVTWADWRLTNLTTEPYWRHRGWRPYAVRLTRQLPAATTWPSSADRL